MVVLSAQFGAKSFEIGHCVRDLVMNDVVTDWWKVDSETKIKALKVCESGQSVGINNNLNVHFYMELSFLHQIIQASNKVKYCKFQNNVKSQNRPWDHILKYVSDNWYLVIR